MKRYIIFLVVALSAIQANVCIGHDSDYYYSSRVYSVDPVYSEGYTRERVYVGTELVCDGRGSSVGTIVGGVSGGVIGSRMVRGRGRILTTGAGILLGSAVGSHFDNHNRCYERERYDYVERRNNRVIGYFVRLENGDEFRTTTRYRVGDIYPRRNY